MHVVSVSISKKLIIVSFIEDEVRVPYLARVPYLSNLMGWRYIQDIVCTCYPV